MEELIEKATLYIEMASLYFGLPAMLIGGLTYLGKYIVKRTADLQYEKLKYEHQVKFSKIYEERYMVIKKIYGLLWQLESTLHNRNENIKSKDKEELYSLREKMKLYESRIISDEEIETLSMEKKEEYLQDFEEMLSIQDEINFFMKKRNKYLKSMANGAKSLLKLIEENRILFNDKDLPSEIMETLSKYLDHYSDQENNKIIPIAELTSHRKSIEKEFRKLLI